MPQEGLPQEAEQVLARSVLTAQIVQMVVGASSVGYIVVAVILAGMNEPFTGFAKLPAEVGAILRCVLWAIGIAMLPLAMFLRGMMWRPEVIASTVKTVADFGALFIRQSVLIAALLDAAAIGGLVLFLLAGSWIDLIGLCALSAAYAAVLFPTAGKAAELAAHIARSPREASRED